MLEVSHTSTFSWARHSKGSGSLTSHGEHTTREGSVPQVPVVRANNAAEGCQQLAVYMKRPAFAVGAQFRANFEVLGDGACWRSWEPWPIDLSCAASHCLQVAEIAHLWQDSATVKGHAWRLYRSTLLGSCRACTPLELAGEDSSGTLSTCGAHLVENHSPRNNTRPINPSFLEGVP